MTSSLSSLLGCGTISLLVTVHQSFQSSCLVKDPISGEDVYSRQVIIPASFMENRSSLTISPIILFICTNHDQFCTSPFSAEGDLIPCHEDSCGYPEKKES
eukprot:TRINITY_DN3294_c0_g1_i14.p1 TRINITY_DN3294_c0_g1~~TRINITY_DN3294_c0_g1_i14.p1  ORF type:complete len:101 (-),score=19.72 TRINITY_DN3294_c0_g1_i14:111-413(-)